MEPLSFSSSKKLVNYLKQSYMAGKHILTINVEHEFGTSSSGILQISRVNALRIYDPKLRKQSTDLIKLQVEVNKIFLTNKLYKHLEKALEIEVQYHIDTVADFCHELTPLKKKLQNFLAHLNEPDEVRMLHPVVDAL